MTAPHFLSIVPDIIMSAADLADSQTSIGNNHYAAGPQLVSADRPILLHLVSQDPQPANDNKKMPIPSVPAALNKFMLALTASRATPLWARREANLWLTSRWSMHALNAGLRLYKQIKNTKPDLLRRIDPTHTIELALYPHQASPRHNLKVWQSQMAPVVPQPTVSKPSRNLKQWMQYAMLMYCWRPLNLNAA